MMKKEQWKETDMIRTIVQQATNEAIIQIDGKTNHTFILNTGAVAMRVIVGENGWSICPAEWDIERCIIG